jgi:hypothetical protein
MTICNGTTSTDDWVIEDPQDVAELIAGAVALAISLFSFPLSGMTQLGERAPAAQAQYTVQADRTASILVNPE